MIYQNEDFIYDSDTGGLIHARRKNNNAQQYSPCATKVNGRGYRSAKINGKTYAQHRIAWFLSKKEWPDGEIDHINGVRTDNRLSNLRAVDSLKQNKNRAIPKNNTSGCIGVHFNKCNSKWVAHIRVNGNRIYLGGFRLKDDAIKVRKQAEAKYNFHPNHGRAR